MSTVGRYLSMNRKRALVVLGAATVGFTIALYLLDPQVQGAGGTGISGFEFAGSRSRAALQHQVDAHRYRDPLCALRSCSST